MKKYERILSGSLIPGDLVETRATCSFSQTENCIRDTSQGYLFSKEKVIDVPGKSLLLFVSGKFFSRGDLPALGNNEGLLSCHFLYNEKDVWLPIIFYLDSKEDQFINSLFLFIKPIKQS